MTHPRKALRQAFKARMLNATACADRVYDTMTPPIDLNATIVAQGPVMMVYLRHEEEREEDYPVDRTDGAFRRRPELTIEVLAVGTPDNPVDDQLDDIAEEIEALVEDWDIPGFPAVDALLMSTQIDVTDTGDRILGGLFMSYHMKVWSPYRQDTTPAPTAADEVFVVPSVNGKPEGYREIIVGDPDADDVWPGLPLRQTPEYT